MKSEKRVESTVARAWTLVAAWTVFCVETRGDPGGAAGVAAFLVLVFSSPRSHLARAVLVVFAMSTLVVYRAFLPATLFAFFVYACVCACACADGEKNVLANIDIKRAVAALRKKLVIECIPGVAVLVFLYASALAGYPDQRGNGDGTGTGNGTENGNEGARAALGIGMCVCFFAVLVRNRWARALLALGDAWVVACELGRSTHAPSWETWGLRMVIRIALWTSTETLISLATCVPEEGGATCDQIEMETDMETDMETETDSPPLPAPAPPPPPPPPPLPLRVSPRRLGDKSYSHPHPHPQTVPPRVASFPAYTPSPLYPVSSSSSSLAVVAPKPRSSGNKPPQQQTQPKPKPRSIVY